MKVGRCDGCGKTAWVNLWLPNKSDTRAATGEYCAGCYERLGLADDLSRSRASKPGKAATRDDAPPSWDDAVRALEEDR